MKRFYINTSQLEGKFIDNEEFLHMKNVLRMKEGDDFIAFCNSESDYHCTITQIKKDLLTFDINDETINSANPSIKLDLFQSLAKGEKLELVAQKATEIGVSTIFPLFVKNCDVKPNSNKPTRLNKIVISACKQCGRSMVPTIEEIITLKQAIPILDTYDLVLFANETESTTSLIESLPQIKNTSSTKIAVIIGPEGGFTQEEICELRNRYKSVSLGKRILRTETAAIYILSVVRDYYRI